MAVVVVVVVVVGAILSRKTIWYCALGVMTKNFLYALGVITK